uniref:Glutaredoxin domain-containing protein n=1 Tax=Chrysotila carterae TaxID=13221 RepID=A0A7S4FAJ0_CHRCT
MKLSASLIILSIQFSNALHIISQPKIICATRTCGQPQMSAAEERIKEMVESNKVMLFMKGNKMFPQCGFSNTAVQILNAVDVPYETFDVLSDQDIREGVKEYAARSRAIFRYLPSRLILALAH